MNKVKKSLLSVVVMLSISIVTYAAEVSFGASFGIAPVFLRGVDAKTLDTSYKNKYGTPENMNVFAQFDVMFEFIPFLALETGIGSKFSVVSYDIVNTLLNSTQEPHQKKKNLVVYF